MVVPIQSYHRPGHSMEGTRLTLVRVPNQPDAYEFSIRTPVTPPRWKDFDAELEAAWEGIMRAFVDGAWGPGLRGAWGPGFRAWEDGICITVDSAHVCVCGGGGRGKYGRRVSGRKAVCVNLFVV